LIGGLVITSTTAENTEKRGPDVCEGKEVPSSPKEASSFVCLCEPVLTGMPLVEVLSRLSFSLETVAWLL
jgi:hypothetical protein